MSRKRKKLIKKAAMQYSRIYPCGTKASLNECFTHHANKLILWFNTKEGFTHAVCSEDVIAA